MFKKIFLSLLLLSFYLNAKDKIALGLLYGDIHFSEKEVKLGAKLWLKNIEKLNLGVELEVFFYENKEDVLKDYKDKKITNIITTGTFFFKNKEFLEKYSKYKWVLSRDKLKFIEYYMIKNKESDFDIKGFKNIKVSYKNDLEKVWAHSVLRKEIENKKSKINYIQKETEKIVALDAFFHKDKVVVIPKEIYELMLQYNSQFKNKTEIVAKSPKIFFRAIGFTRDGVGETLDKIYKDINDKINNNRVDLSVLSYVQIQNVFLIENNELEELGVLYKNYGEVLK
ncbi:hypothetical protein [Arcobacter arenosus]|uniref:ABC transporter substrate-binding protein n=1 Tax=Arcobacter arenosus TaxID=2576037 RepID=A0A5R8Y0J7_9BACT|nr:hypothetical protein [Arcobacter arenosus]TLP38389.1 hypothetical protein FDK22_07915 [Arcobacter arenosus]